MRGTIARADAPPDVFLALHLAADGSVIDVTAANNPREIRADQALIKSRQPVDRVTRRSRSAAAAADPGTTRTSRSAHAGHLAPLAHELGVRLQNVSQSVGAGTRVGDRNAARRRRRPPAANRARSRRRRFFCPGTPGSVGEQLRRFRVRRFSKCRQAPGVAVRPSGALTNAIGAPFLNLPEADYCLEILVLAVHRAVELLHMDQARAGSARQLLPVVVAVDLPDHIPGHVCRPDVDTLTLIASFHFGSSRSFQFFGASSAGTRSGL